jgi:hypothetical protein
MPSSWTYPSIVTQFADSDHHVRWLNVGNDFFSLNQIRAERDLLHISNPNANDLRETTYYLLFRGWEWEDLPVTISGIEVMVNLKRVGRITDDTIQLYYNQAIGDNKANAEISDEKILGGETDLWGYDLTPEIVTDDNFGVLLRLKSHPSWPHKCTPNITHIQIRAW